MAPVDESAPCVAVEPPCRALFIRAPAIVRAGPRMQPLATYQPAAGSGGASASPSAEPVVVAARQDRLLVTSFHPELTRDLRWHQYFVDMCRAS